MKECPLCCFLDHHALNKSDPKEQQQRHRHQQQPEQHGSKSASRFKETKQDDASSYGSNQAEEVLRPTTGTKDRYQRGAKERVFRPPPPRLQTVASPPPPPPPPPPKTIMYPPPPRPTNRKVLNETDRHSRHLPSSSVEEKTPVMQEISTSASNLSSEASAFLSHSRSSLSSEATWFGASDDMILPNAKTEQVLQDDEDDDEEQQKATRHGRQSCAVALEKKLKDRKEKLRRLRMSTRLGQTPTGLEKRSSSPHSVETDHSNETECRSNATGMNHSVAWYADDSSSKLEEANERIQNDLAMEAMEAVFDTLLDFGSSTSDDQNAVERAIDCEPGPEAEEYQSRTEKKKKKKNKQKGVKDVSREEMVRSDCRTPEKRSRRKKEKVSSRKTEEDTQERDVWCAPKLTKENNPDSISKIDAENYISGHEFETSNELNERLGYHKLATGQSLSVSDLDSSAEDSSRESQPIWSNKFNGREKKWNPSRRKQSRRHNDYVAEGAAAVERGSHSGEEKELHCSSSLPVESDGETYEAPESEEDSTSHETSESLESHDTLLSDGLKDYEEVFAEAGSSNYVQHDEENAYDEYFYSDEEDHSVPSVIAESDDESYQDSSSRSDGSNISGSSSISDITPFTDASSMFHRIDHHGRCIYHPYIQLSKKTRVLGKSGLRTAWKVISVNCSECCFEEIVRLRKQNRDTRGIVVGKEGKNHRPRLGSQETVTTKSMTSSEMPSDSSHDGDDSSFRSDPAGEKYDPYGMARPSNFPPPRYPRAMDKDDSYNMNRYDSTSTSTSKSSSYTGSSGETMSTLSLSFPDTFGEESGSPSRPKGILRAPSSGRSVCSAKSQKSTVTFAGRDHIVSFCSAIWTIGQDEVK
jgi:hypothetical protein